MDAIETQTIERDGQTYRITIEEGTITDRRRVGAEDNCDSETYEPI